MKKKEDKRHLRRMKLVQALFTQSFKGAKTDIRDEKLNSIAQNLVNIDPLIEEAAPQFPISKISPVDVAILRLAIYEMVYEKKEPHKVIIDEAIELAKELGGEGSPAFINGVLATVYKKVVAK